MFFAGAVALPFQTLLSALMLLGLILLGICMTLLMSRLLSKTVLKGMPSSFALELPPYRRPQILKVIVRSIFDRTLFVLGRAVVVALPAGLVIWLLANITVNDSSLLQYCTDFLNPFARFFGLDGVILMAFILGFPANEIVIPIMLMTYLEQGSLQEINDPNLLRAILSENGWSLGTAVCTCLFTLFHWPCLTTLLSIKRETGSLKWTAAAFALPTLFGVLLCILFAQTAAFFLPAP